MSPHEKVPSDLNAKKVIRALKRLGFSIDERGGKGSHVKATWTNQKAITIQKKLHKNAMRGLLAEIESISGLTWEDIKEEI